MAQRLGAFTSLAEDLGSIPRAHMAVPNHLWLCFPWVQCHLLTSLGTSCRQWLSTFLIQRPFKIVSRVVVGPSHKSIPLPLHICKIATIMNCNVGIWYAGYLICQSQMGHDPQIENPWCPCIHSRKTFVHMKIKLNILKTISNSYARDTLIGCILCNIQTMVGTPIP